MLVICSCRHLSPSLCGRVFCCFVFWCCYLCFLVCLLACLLACLLTWLFVCLLVCCLLLSFVTRVSVCLSANACLVWFFWVWDGVVFGALSLDEGLVLGLFCPVGSGFSTRSGGSGLEARMCQNHQQLSEIRSHSLQQRICPPSIAPLVRKDLASILKSTQPLTVTGLNLRPRYCLRRNHCHTRQDDHCQFFLYQILRGMKYVHSAQARLFVPSLFGIADAWSA